MVTNEQLCAIAAMQDRVRAEEEEENRRARAQEEEENRRARAQVEARRNAEHEIRVPLEFCCCINCQERRLADQAMEDLPY